MTHSESELVEGYAAVVGVSQLIPDEALDWQPGSEGWSLRSIMSHLAHANDCYENAGARADASTSGAATATVGASGLSSVRRTL